MTKKGPLGKAEMFYVEHHCSQMEAKDIATELDRPIATVKRHIETVQTGESSTISAGASMARQDGVVTMTETSSSLSDAKRKMRGKLREDCVVEINHSNQGNN